MSAFRLKVPCSEAQVDDTMSPEGIRSIRLEKVYFRFNFAPSG